MSEKDTIGYLCGGRGGDDYIYPHKDETMEEYELRMERSRAKRKPLTKEGREFVDMIVKLAEQHS